MEVTVQKIKEIFKQEVDKRVDVENMDPAISITDQGIDSLDRSSVFLTLEDEYGVTIEDQDIEELDTIDKIIDFLKGKTKEK